MTFGSALNDRFMPKLVDRADLDEYTLEQHLKHVDGNQGGTALWQSVGSMVSAIDERMGGEREQMLVVLTDGEDTHGGQWTVPQLRTELEARPRLK